MVTGTMMAGGGMYPRTPIFRTPYLLSGRVRLISVQSGAATTINVGSDGNYTVSLAPGAYRLSCEAPTIGGGQWNGTGKPVTVVAGQTTKAGCWFSFS
jgi:hypothetical protein